MSSLEQKRSPFGTTATRLSLSLGETKRIQARLDAAVGAIPVTKDELTMKNF